MAADGNGSYHIEHHYLDKYYDDLYLVGCTSTHAFVITRVGDEDFFAHRISLERAANAKELNEGKYTSLWTHYDGVIHNYLHACVHGAYLCVLTMKGVIIYDTDESRSIREMEFDTVHACAMNEEYLIVIYNQRYIFVYNHYINHVVCNRVFDHGKDVYVVAVNFFMMNVRMFIVNTSGNGTHFYRITENTVTLHKSICLLDTDMTINFTREIHNQVLVTAADFEMSVAWPNAAGSVLRKRTNFTAYLVDVALLTNARSMLAVHDIENDIQFLNADLDTVFMVSNRRLMQPHTDLGLSVHRIQRAYKSMTMCPDSANILAVLLPSADLCTIKFF